MSSFDVLQLITKKDMSNNRHFYGTISFVSNGNYHRKRIWCREGCPVNFAHYAHTDRMQVIMKRKVRYDGYSPVTPEQLGSRWQPIKADIEQYIMMYVLKGY